MNEILIGHTIESMINSTNDERLRKEKAAILSEMSLINSIEYRRENQILSALHSDNILSKRFPIGEASQVEQFTPHDLASFHRTHYHPHKAILYLGA